MDTAKVLDIRDKVNQGRRGKVVKKLVEIIKEYELTYDEFVELCGDAREQMQLVRQKRVQVIKPVPSLEDVKRFLQVVARHSNEHVIMMKVLIFMGIRSCELVRIKLADLDLTPGTERLFLHRKAGLDGTFTIPKRLADLLTAYLDNPERKKQVYLFERAYHEPYSEKAGTVRKLVQKYRIEAGLGEEFHPHNFRHLLLTTLGGDNWTDTKLQNVSGHKSRTSLDPYIQHNAERIRKQFNDSINRLMAEV